MNDWIKKLLSNPDMLAMGHAQSVDDLNLGLGFVYYGLVRAMRSRRAVVIGSWRGFAPLILAKAMMDNEKGNVLFLDPSLVDDFWTDPGRVNAYFHSFGVPNIRHVPMTTQAFAATPEFNELRDIDFLFIDGLHSLEQVAFDYDTFRPRLAPDALVLFHDSLRVRTSRIYGDGRPYEQQVRTFVDLLKQDESLELFDLPAGDGVTLLRRRTPAA